MSQRYVARGRSRSHIQKAPAAAMSRKRATKTETITLRMRPVTSCAWMASIWERNPRSGTSCMPPLSAVLPLTNTQGSM